MEDLSHYSTEQLKEMLNAPATDTSPPRTEAPSNDAGNQRSDAPDLSGYSTAKLKSMLGKSWRQWLGDVGAAAGSGLVKGAAAIPGIAGDIEGLARTGARALGSDTAEETVLPTSAETQRWVGEAVPALQGALNYRPETTAGEYAQTIGEFAPVVLAGRPIKNAAALGRKALTKIVPAAERIAPEIAATSNLPTAGEVATQVVAPAMASEGAGKATEGTWLEPAARLTGAVAGHAGASGLRNAFGTREGARYAVRNATEFWNHCWPGRLENWRRLTRQRTMLSLLYSQQNRLRAVRALYPTPLAVWRRRTRTWRVSLSVLFWILSSLPLQNSLAARLIQRPAQDLRPMWLEIRRAKLIFTPP